MSTPRVTAMNQAVTDALLRAEVAIENARRAWVEVTRLEGALATALHESGRHDVEYEIAARGLGRAGIIVEMLEALRGPL